MKRVFAFMLTVVVGFAQKLSNTNSLETVNR